MGVHPTDRWCPQFRPRADVCKTSEPLDCCRTCSQCWAICASFSPGTHDLAENSLCARGGRPPAPRRPRPTDKRVLTKVMQQICHVATAIALAVFDLLANLPEGAAFPGHRYRREVPFRMSGNARRIEIRWSMTRVARKSRSAVPIGPTHDQRLMWAHAIGLART